jgi:kinetochore protein Mis12/MTW1
LTSSAPCLGLEICTSSEDVLIRPLPYSACPSQHEAANAEIFTSLDALERYLSARLTAPAGSGASEAQLEDEMHTGLHAAETLLTNQMDSAMDLLTSWTFRNAFTVGEAGSSIVLVSRIRQPRPLSLLSPVAPHRLTFNRSSLIRLQPDHEGLDFLRGQYVASLPGGERSLDASIEALRTRVEQVWPTSGICLMAAKDS